MSQTQWGSGEMHCGAAPGSYRSPKQQFLRYSSHFLQQYQQQEASELGATDSTASAAGDYQVNAQEIITSSRSVYQVLELLGESNWCDLGTPNGRGGGDLVVKS